MNLPTTLPGRKVQSWAPSKMTEHRILGEETGLTASTRELRSRRGAQEHEFLAWTPRAFMGGARLPQASGGLEPQIQGDTPRWRQHLYF